MSILDGGIHAQQPSAWTPQRVNLRGLATELSKAAAKLSVAAVTGTGFAGLVTSFPDLVAALTNVGTITDEERAYILVQRALAGAIAEIVKEACPDPRMLSDKTVADGLVGQAGVNEDTWTLAPNFLEHPREIELVHKAISFLESWLVAWNVPADIVQAKVEVLPDYFSLKLHEEQAKHPTYYEPLMKRFKLETSPLAQEKWEWERYRYKIISAPEKPLFGDKKASLRDVFVPLRAKWKEQLKDGVVFHEIELDEELVAWFGDTKRDDCLRIISGEPGSGKSSCAKMWASKIAKQRPGWRVIYIKLHDFDFTGDMKSSLTSYLKDEERITADLLDMQSTEKVLVFFDNLDEIAITGKTAREAAASFVTHVRSMLRSVNESERRFLVVLGGRELVVRDCLSEIRDLRQILYLEPYNAEQRTDWWKQYGVASERKYTDLPEALQREDLDHLTCQPLLNYLLALSYGRFQDSPNGVVSGLDFSERVTINEIYADLLHSVWLGVWGAENLQLTGKSRVLPEDDFIALLEEVGVSVWHSDSRSSSLSDIKDRCLKAGLGEELKILEEEASDGVFRLLTAFHLRFRDIGEKVVEFTHKSFGEYLAALRVVRLMEKLSYDRVSAQSPEGRRRRAVWSPESALKEWVELCGPKPLDETDRNLYELMLAEVRAKSKETREEIRDTFVELASTMIQTGMPILQGGMTFDEMEYQSRNAEESLLCALYSCLSPPIDLYNEVETSQRNTDEVIPVVEDAAPLIARWHFRRGVNAWQMGGACLSSLHYLGRSLRYSNFTDAYLRGAYLTRASLTQAHMTRADLSQAILNRADLVGADLVEAHLIQADLTRADMIGAYLRGADLSRAYLKDADLREADLRDANLTRAYMKGANLTGANLTGANLTDARFWRDAIGLDLSYVDVAKRPKDWNESVVELIDATSMRQADS